MRDYEPAQHEEQINGKPSTVKYGVSSGLSVVKDHHAQGCHTAHTV
jgi:hypothetical protein